MRSGGSGHVKKRNKRHNQNKKCEYVNMKENVRSWIKMITSRWCRCIGKMIGPRAHLLRGVSCMLVDLFVCLLVCLFVCLGGGDFVLSQSAWELKLYQNLSFWMMCLTHISNKAPPPHPTHPTTTTTFFKEDSKNDKKWTTRMEGNVVVDSLSLSFSLTCSLSLHLSFSRSLSIYI